MFIRINFVRVPHKGWMKMDSSFAEKIAEIVSLTLTLFPTSLDGVSLPFLLVHRLFIAHVLFDVGVFVFCMLPMPYSPNCSVFLILRFFARSL